MSFRLTDPSAARRACSALSEVLRVVARTSPGHKRVDDIVCGAALVCTVFGISPAHASDFIRDAVPARDLPDGAQLAYAAGLWEQAVALFKRAYLIQDEEQLGHARDGVIGHAFTLAGDAFIELGVPTNGDCDFIIPSDARALIDARWPL